MELRRFPARGALRKAPPYPAVASASRNARSVLSTWRPLLRLPVIRPRQHARQPPASRETACAWRTIRKDQAGRQAATEIGGNSLATLRNRVHVVHVAAARRALRACGLNGAVARPRAW